MGALDTIKNLLKNNETWVDRQAEHLIVHEGLRAAASSLQASLGGDTARRQPILNRIADALRGAVEDASSHGPLAPIPLHGPDAIPLSSADRSRTTPLFSDTMNERDAESARNALEHGLKKAYTGLKAAQFAGQTESTAHKVAHKLHLDGEWLSAQARQVMEDFALESARATLAEKLPAVQREQAEALVKPVLTTAIEDNIHHGSVAAIRIDERPGKTELHATEEARAALHQQLAARGDDALSSAVYAAAHTGLETAMNGLRDARFFNEGEKIPGRPR